MTNATSIKKNNCRFNGCKNKVALIVGECFYCKKNHCSQHRLPEMHACEKIEACRKHAFDENAARLIANKCHNKKIEAI